MKIVNLRSLLVFISLLFVCLIQNAFAICGDPEWTCPCGYGPRGGAPYVENVPMPDNPICGCYPTGVGYPQEMQAAMDRCGADWGCDDDNSHDCVNPCDDPQLEAPGCPWEEPEPCADGTFRMDGICDDRCPDGSEPNEDGECEDNRCPDGSAPNEDDNCDDDMCPDGSEPNEEGECEDFRCPDGSSPPNHAEGECEDDLCPDGSEPNENGECGEECRNDIFFEPWDIHVNNIECVPDCETRRLSCEYQRCDGPTTFLSGLSLDAIPVGSVRGYSSACPEPECPRNMEYNEEARSCVCEIGGARTFPYSDECPIGRCENGEPYYSMEECCEDGSIADLHRCRDDCSNDILFSALGRPSVAQAVNIRVNTVECIPDCREGKRALQCTYQRCGERPKNIDLSLLSIVPSTYTGYDELCPNTPTCPTEELRWDDWRKTCICPDGEVPSGNECNCQNDVHFPQLDIMIKEAPACYENCNTGQVECTYKRCGEAESPPDYFDLSEFPDLERKCCAPESGTEWDNFQDACVCPQSGEPPPEDTGICACEEDSLFPPEDILVKSWRCKVTDCGNGTVSCTYEMCNGDPISPPPYNFFEDDRVSTYRSECN
ncbi:MAG: hypothetical protein COA45_08550 [Zetaproteobacteria bacterium]|nr:MAG: hypothetical protein COA45_08550 [Zetaproteobacteria bacterium]